MVPERAHCQCFGGDLETQGATDASRYHQSAGRAFARVLMVLLSGLGLYSASSGTQLAESVYEYTVNIHMIPESDCFAVDVKVHSFLSEGQAPCQG